MQVPRLGNHSQANDSASLGMTSGGVELARVELAAG